MIVKDMLTPLSRDDASRAFLAAYQQLTGKPPTAAVLALLLAQSAFETGHWKSLHHFNFGNAKAGPNYPLITQFRCSEVENGVETFYDPPHPQCNFRAYENAAAGALDYLKVLQNRPHWWQGLHTGDPSAFVDALATPPKYFTGNPVVYKRSVVSLFNGFLPLARAALSPALVRPVPPASPFAPAPLPSSSSASPPSGSSGAPPALSNAANSGKPTAATPAPSPLPPPQAEDSGVVAVKRPFCRRLLSLVLRVVRVLFRSPPGGSG